MRGTDELMLVIRSMIAISEYYPIFNSLQAGSGDIICIRVLMLLSQIHKSVPDVPYISSLIFTPIARKKT